jgi:hypothetical protein
MKEEVIELWNKAPKYSQPEQKKIADYQAKREKEGEKMCPYSRQPQKGGLMCKIHTKRCYFKESYTECDVAVEYILDDMAQGLI